MGPQASRATRFSVGIHFVKSAVALQEMDAIVVGISEERGGVRCSTGVDMEELGVHLRQCGSLAGYEAGTPTVEVHHLDCDLLVIGAPESTLSPAAAARVRAKLLVETSELVITPFAACNLSDRNIAVIPDLVGGAASVLAAHAEWSNNLQGLSPDEDHVKQEVETGVVRAYEHVAERSQRDGISLRLAAYSAAIERVAKAERLRVA